MKPVLRYFTLLTLVVLMGTDMSAQLTSVDYQLKYDTATCLYDGYLIVNAGSANNPVTRTQGSSQFSIVVPSDVGVSVDTSHNPLQDNFISGTGTIPQDWDITTSFTDGGFTYHSITVALGPTSRYNNLAGGDTVKLFSLALDTVYNCATDVRMWDNDADPDPGPNTGNGQFDNGFTIGGLNQIYNGNSTQIYPPNPVIVDAVVGCSNGIEIDLTASTTDCQGDLSFDWTGPASFSSTDEDVSITPSTPANSGIYEVLVTDEFGCKDSLEVIATGKPLASGPATVCAGTIDTLVGTNPTTGTWSYTNNQLFGMDDLTPLGVSTGLAQVTFGDFASGDYIFIYSIPGGCADTFTIAVQPKPIVNISGDNTICVGDNTVLSAGGTAGTWSADDPAIATVGANTGIVTGVSVGNATFTFTATATGCTSTTSDVTVSGGPAVSAPQPAVCVDLTLQATPSTGGTWTALTPAFATITTGGLITGVAEGTAQFIFQETSSTCYSDTLEIDVTGKPVVSVTGSDSLCINGTTQLSPSTGGVWMSLDETIATVSNTGVVTAVAPGITQFVYTAIASQCPSDPTPDVTVFADPIVDVVGDENICIGATTQLSPATGGTWTSSNPGVATVTNAGVVTANENGFATFTFTDDVTGCDATTEAVIVDGSPTVSVGATDICISETTDLSPTTALGTWVALNPDTAQILGNGFTIEGVTAGTAGFIYTENSSGCKSDTIFVTVDPGPSVSISGPDSVCVNEVSQLQPSTGGVWTSSDDNIATVSNAGFVVGVAPGQVTFTYTDISNGCQSLPTDPFTVTPIPVTQFFGDDNLCVGEFSQILPSIGGTWVSSNTAVATITNTGAITAVAPGSATFTFTSASTGCSSEESPSLVVNAVPQVSFTGPSDVCIGENTFLEPTTGGIWTSSNTAVATVTNSGVVTAVSAGNTVFTFTQTGSDCPSNGLVATINPTPVVTIDGDTELCVGETSSASSTLAGGSWASSDPAVATVNTAGVITAVAQGTATISYISADGCESAQSEAITVEGAPTVTLAADEMCINETQQLTPSTGGTWTSGNTAIATITPGGLVTAIAAGDVQFTFENDNGCESAATDFMTVNPDPEIFWNGPTTICIGENTNITPSTGGVWTSSDPTIATINNSGLITGVAPGKVVFTYADGVTNCNSAPSDSLEVTAGPDVSIGGDSDLCIGESTFLLPATGGTWTSNDPTVATVTASGVVTAVAPGSATFFFTDDAGCNSEPTEAVVVNNGATVTIDGPDQLCINETTNVVPATGGTWTSSDNSVATVTNAGVVTAVGNGSATFTFTDTNTGCVSLPTAPVTVDPAPNVSISGETSICIGATTTVTAGGASGTWTSSDPSIATVDNNGLVTAFAAGTVSFSFVNSTGCASAANTDDLTISACADPDFNVTYVDVPVPGDVSTNDAVPVGTTYGPTTEIVSTSSPAGSLFSIDINSAGEYTFTGNTVGVYTFDVPVCVPPLTSGCATAELTITVLDFLEPDNRPVANVDVATTELNTPVTLATLANDRCVVTTGCSLDPMSVTIEVVSRNGGQTINGGNGDITYTPVNGFIGFDTLTYQVCVLGEPTNCATADQIILVNPPSAANTTQAADDFAVTQQGEPVSGDVSTNDTDAEGDVQTVTGYTSTVPGVGTLVLNNDGTYTFTPEQGFFGPVDFPYTTTDDNALGAATADATLHILVVKDLTVEVRVYLTGALVNNRNEEAPDGRPLMRDDLRSSPFTGSTYIPTSDPYTVATQFMTFPAMKDSFIHVAAGLRSDFVDISNPASVFAVTGQDAVVDWVFVELRDKGDNTSVVSTRSGLVQRDGDVVDMDGVTGLRFPGLAVDSYYVVVRHRNHLGAMTANPQTPRELADLVDFTVPTTPIFDFGTNLNSLDYSELSQNSMVKPNWLALWGGNFDASNKVKYDNPDDDLVTLFLDVLGYPTNTFGSINFDFAYGYLQGDFDMNSKSKFDNPNDDKNYIFLTVLLYPLNDGIFLSNFDLFFEQVPARD